jgi:hypothetical protein
VNGLNYINRLTNVNLMGVVAAVDTGQFLKSKEYFPIVINLSDGETIRVVSRLRKTENIIDILSNDSHIGMLIGVDKVDNMIKIGPAVVNKSHEFRNMLTFVFVKLLEYYGLDNVKVISVKEPDNFEFHEFLASVGFVVLGKNMVLDITGDNVQKFLEKLSKIDVNVRTQKGQIEAVLKLNNANVDVNKIQELSGKIFEKVSKDESLDKIYWDNRRISQINVMVSSAYWQQGTLIKEEFLEIFIKTLVSAFDLNLRLPVLYDLIDALKGKKPFEQNYVQKIVEKLQKICKAEIKHMTPNKYEDWIKENMSGWELNKKVLEETDKNKKESSKLKIEDFGGINNPATKLMVESLINHYNGNVEFFGLKNRLDN